MKRGELVVFDGDLVVGQNGPGTGNGASRRASAPKRGVGAADPVGSAGRTVTIGRVWPVSTAGRCVK